MAIAIFHVTHTHYYTDYIGRVDVDSVPTVRVGSQAVANVNPKLRGGLPYAGLLLYHIVGENGENFTDVVTANSDGSLTLQFSPYPDTITKSKDVLVTFVFWNHISNSSVRKSLGVVGEFSRMFYPCFDAATAMTLAMQCLETMEVWHSSLRCLTCPHTTTPRNGWLNLKLALSKLFSSTM